MESHFVSPPLEDFLLWLLLSSLAHSLSIYSFGFNPALSLMHCATSKVSPLLNLILAFFTFFLFYFVTACESIVERRLICQPKETVKVSRARLLVTSHRAHIQMMMANEVEKTQAELRIFPKKTQKKTFSLLSRLFWLCLFAALCQSVSWKRIMWGTKEGKTRLRYRTRECDLSDWSELRSGKSRLPVMLLALDADGKTDCGMETRSFERLWKFSALSVLRIFPFALSDFSFSKINAERRTQSGKAENRDRFVISFSFFRFSRSLNLRSMTCVDVMNVESPFSTVRQLKSSEEIDAFSHAQVHHVVFLHPPLSPLLLFAFSERRRARVRTEWKTKVSFPS